MLFLIVLLLATALSMVVARRSSRRDHARIGLGLAMGFAGAAHLFMPDPFIQHLPTWVPARTELIYFTGLVEIALGAAMVVRTSVLPWASLMLAAYLVAVFPSNIYVAVEGVEVDGQPGGLYPWLRLTLQPLFVALALWSGRGLDGLDALRSLLPQTALANETARPAVRVETSS
jgi:uncharacterized membrane protein